MKNIIILFLALLAISCKSQIVSLETAAQCSEANPCSNFNYVKDINNTLNKYVGTWKGTYNGRVYEMKFNKSLYDDMGFKRDKITGRLKITIPGSIPLIVFDNFNEPDDSKTRFSGLGLTGNLQSYETHFSGPFTKGCINRGSIFLKINPSTPNEMRVIYWSDRDIAVGECPSAFSQTFTENQEIILMRQ